MQVHKPRILVDFDGVLHDYVASGGWQGVSSIPGPPKRGALEWLNSLLEEFDVCVYSTRSSQVGGLLAMQRWLKQNWPKGLELPVDGAGELMIRFPREKLPAKVTIDDRCVRFSGQFPPVEELAVYRPYDVPVAEIELTKERDRSYWTGRADQLGQAAASYGALAREFADRPEWVAQLADIARQVRALADEIQQATPPV